MQDLTGKTIGGYQIVEQIGRGGMATVFRAYQPSLDRDVAVKVLPPYYAQQDDAFLQRFKREARAIAKLRHPNILMVMDFGQDDDLSYIVMEYVTAGTLKDRLKEPIQLREIYELTKQIASALQYAHDQGVVHRDVKPSNIMMPKPDWALLTDFGLAHMVGGSFLTQSGMTVGTPAYMSPEQGSGGKIDHRTDIYSLGVMLYEMVVGEVPYTAETPMAVVVKHIVDPLPMPRAKNPDIPEEMQRIILKALAKNPDDRYQNISEIPAALEKVVGTHPDWSAAEMKAVNPSRELPIDMPETKVFDEESPEADQVLDLTEGEMPAEKPPAEPEPQPTESEPIPPTVGFEAVPEEAPAVDLEPEIDIEPATQAEQPAPSSPAVKAAAKRQAVPPVRKSPRWPLILGGLFLLVVCAVVGLFALNAIFGNQTSNQVNNVTQAVEELTPGENIVVDPDAVEVPDNVDVQTIVDLLEKNDFKRATHVLKIALERNPNLWEALLQTVERMERRGEYKNAARLLGVGLEANPTPSPENFGWLGWLYYSDNAYPEAVAAFEESLRRMPNLVEAHDGYVNTVIMIDQIPGAIRFLEDLKAKHPEEIQIYRSLGDLYDYNGEIDKAIEAYERGMELAPRDPWLPVHAASVYYYAGDEGRARELLNRAVESAPNDPGILSRAAWTFFDMLDIEQAYLNFERAYELDQQDGWTALGLAQSIFYSGREPDQIWPLLNEAEQVGREVQDAWLLTDTGWFFLDMGDCENAVRLFNQVEQFAPGMTDAQEGLSECY